ncbi:MAG: VanZ family protein [Clostridiales Family XIII bacterium]|jgi:glycopeptide antibiotics resistance protein|nr:VanZ family protein [Clostridiales Family XIII bacterium]
MDRKRKQLTREDTMEFKKQNTITAILCMVYLLLLTGIILFKLPFYSPELSDGIRVINLIPLQGSFDENGVLIWREIMNNILIFVPSGIYICMLKNEWSIARKLIPVIALTFTFEILQFIFALGRSDITDILGNTLGGIIGIGLYSLSFTILKSRTLKIVTIVAAAVTVCVVLRFVYLFYLSHFVM